MFSSQIIKREKHLIVGLLIIALLLALAPANLLGQNKDQKICFVINGSSLMNVPFEVKEDYTLIPLQHFAQVTGTSQHQPLIEQATLTKGDQTINLSSGSTQVITTKSGTMQAPVSPMIKDGLMYVPLRFLCEQFNIAVHWDANANTISFDLDNTRLDMTAPKLLGKAQEICNETASYQVDSKVNTTLYKADNTLLSSIYVEGTEMVRQDPYTAYLVQTTKDQLKGAMTKNQFLVTNQQIFTKEDEEPWVAASVNVNSLLRNREKIASLTLADATTASELNPVYTFADDTIYRGQPCYVIKLYFSPAMFQENIKEFLPILNSVQINEEIKTLFSGLTIEKFQTIYINKDTLQQAGTEIFEEIKLHVQGEKQPFARFHTEGKLVFSNKPFTLPDDIPVLMY